ncbi:MAG: DegQ family serine endoprotease [Dongiaceae bacterium]
MPEFNRRPHSWSRRARLTAAALLCTTMLTGVGALTQVLPAQADQQSPAPLAAPAATAARPDGFANIVDAVKPAVVNIAVDKKGVAMVAADGNDTPDVPGLPNIPGLPKGFPFGNQDGGKGKGHHHQDGESGRAVGSGFIIDPAGYIVTNNHVIENSDSIKVTLADGSTHDAKLIGTDPKTDVALIKIDGKDLPYVQFGDSAKARVGDWVLAIGDPYGLGGTVTAGIVSARGRDIGAGPYDDFIQIDAPINPGNSGGPLFDGSGKVIGVSTAIYSPNGGSVGIGFAIPSATVSKIAAELRDHGKIERGWLGITMQPMTPELAQAMGRSNEDGVLVNAVQPDSPAAKAELQQGDIITAFDGKAVKDPKALARAVADAHGSDAKITVMRDGKEQVLSAKIGQAPADQTASAEDAAGGERGAVGLALAPITPEMRDQLGLDGSVKGAVVTQVVPDSKAAASGLQEGDVILKVGGQAVASPKDAVQRIHAAMAAKKPAVAVLVMRDGETSFMALQLAKA